MSVKRIVFTVVCIAVAAIAFLKINSVRTSLNAESTLHAQYKVLDAIEHYASTHENTWPSSWEELERAEIPSQRGQWNWPRDSEHIKKVVRVDFAALSEGVVRDSDGSFAIVSPVGASYRMSANRVERFIAFAQEYVLDGQGVD